MAKKLQKEIAKILKEVSDSEIQEIRKEVQAIPRKGEWDFPKEVEIQYFDPLLSYELTGYKPITKTQGLDFDPNWFTEPRRNFEKLGHYCPYGNKTKQFREFWITQYKRSKYGCTINGYTLTGDHYFFLNFYVLPLTTKTTKAGQGRPEGFPSFSVAQYKWFHYYELAKHTRLNCCMMKARGVGRLMPTINSAKSVKADIMLIPR